MLVTTLAPLHKHKQRILATIVWLVLPTARCSEYSEPSGCSESPEHTAPSMQNILWCTAASNTANAALSEDAAQRRSIRRTVAGGWEEHH